MDLITRTIYVENFPLDTERDVLKKLFTHFGKIKHVEMPTFDKEHPINKNSPLLKAKGYAFIEFYNKSDADKACSHYNNLENILCCQQETQLDDNYSDDNKQQQLDDMTKQVEEHIKPDGGQNKFIHDNRYKLLRVMSKKNFKEFSRRYDEERFQSLVKASKLFYCS